MKYQTKRLPGGSIRVVNVEQDRVEGAWHQDDKQWFDIAGFIEDNTPDYSDNRR